METTLYLLRNPRNAAALRKARTALNKGNGIEFDPTLATQSGHRAASSGNSAKPRGLDRPREPGVDDRD